MNGKDQDELAFRLLEHSLTLANDEIKSLTLRLKNANAMIDLLRDTLEIERDARHRLAEKVGDVTRLEIDKRRACALLEELKILAVAAGDPIFFDNLEIATRRVAERMKA